ncbi:hypothetical protein HN011_002062 [Eciton burchellii]|nr:hypothetical protein HN011_002062 [Eciton burchellii]
MEVWLQSANLLRLGLLETRMNYSLKFRKSLDSYFDKITRCNESLSTRNVISLQSALARYLHWKIRQNVIRCNYDDDDDDSLHPIIQ